MNKKRKNMKVSFYLEDYLNSDQIYSSNIKIFNET